MSSSLKIRRARIKDAKEISVLRKNTIKKVNGPDLSKKEIDYLMERNKTDRIRDKIKEREMFCLIDKNKITGTVDLHDTEIGSVYVHHNSVKKGLGTILMNFIENYALSKGIKLVHLKAAEQAKGFYLKRGYKLIKRVKYDSGLTNFIMEKKLK